MNKICTSLEQSEKLIELGIDVKTADMCYKYVLPKSDRICHVPEIGNPIESLEWYNKGYTTSGKEPITLDEYCIPAWSLSALMKLIPSMFFVDTRDTYYSLCIYKWEKFYELYYKDESTGCCVTDCDVMKDNLLDATYEMVVRLLKKGYIKKD